MSKVSRAGILWTVGAALAVAALGWQALHELGVRECLRDSEGLLVLCDGRLDDWVLPGNLLAALMLVGIWIWRFVPPPRD